MTNIENSTLPKIVKGDLDLTYLEIANKTYDRHSFITDLLISLGVNEDTAKEDACKIEHNLSDETFTAIKRYFNSFQNK